MKIERVKVRPRGKTIIGMLLNCATFVVEGKKWVKKCKQRYDAVYVFEVSPVTVGLPAIEYKKRFGSPIYFNVQDLWPENVEVVLGVRNKLILGIINKTVEIVIISCYNWKNREEGDPPCIKCAKQSSLPGGSGNLNWDFWRQ